MSVKVNGKEVPFPLNILVLIVVLPIVAVFLVGVFLAVMFFVIGIVATLSAPLWIPILLIINLIAK